MLKNLRVRTKLAVVLTVPLVALVAIGALGVLDRRDRADEARRGKQLTELLAARLELVQQYQIDRIWISTAGPAAAGARQQLVTTRDALAAARTTYDDRARAVAGASPELTTALADATSALDAVASARTEAEQGTGLPNAIAAYDWALAALARVGVEGTRTSTGRAPGELASLLDLTTLKDDVATLAARTTAAIGTNATGAALDPLRQRQVLVDERERAFGASAGPEARTAYETQLADPGVQQAISATKTFLSTGTDRAAPGDVPAWLNANAARLAGLRQVEAVVANRVGETAAAAEADATAEARNFALAMAAAVLISLLLASLVARSIARPLGRLTQRANELAEHELPALVQRLRAPAGDAAAPALAEFPVRSNDEVGQLARAINSIQGVTRRVAEEQATLLRKGIGEIFVSLARRNQTLLDRQIEFIDHLEAGEEDPDQLQNLFRLDHLATRMRRNAESLLVLAGAEAPRRRGRPVDLIDVTRVAIGEVEHFTRIQLVTFDDATVIGGVAVDLAHLLAELMENATQFSPPDAPVEVRGVRREEGDYVVTVLDHGIGMTAEQLDEANSTIVHPPSVGLAGVRSLGFTVVGRLAQRHGFGVRLAGGSEGGVLASVFVPRTLLDADAAPSHSHGMATAPAPSAPAEVPDLALFDLAPRAVAPEVDVLADLTAAAPEAPRAPAIDDAPPAYTFRPVPAFTPAPPPIETPVVADTPVTDTPVTDTPAIAPAIAEGPPPVPPVVMTPPAAAVAPPPAPLAVRPPLPTRAPVTSPCPLAPATPSAAAAAPAAPFEGLTRRVPRAEAAPVDRTPAVRASGRSPEEVRQMLSRYRSGLQRGRTDDESSETTE